MNENSQTIKVINEQRVTLTFDYTETGNAIEFSGHSFPMCADTTRDL